MSACARPAPCSAEAPTAAAAGGEGGGLRVAHLDDVGAVVGGEARGQLVDQARPLLIFDDQRRTGVLLLERLREVIAGILRRVGADEPHAQLSGPGDPSGGIGRVSGHPELSGQDHDGRAAEDDVLALLRHSHLHAVVELGERAGAQCLDGRDREGSVEKS